MRYETIACCSRATKGGTVPLDDGFDTDTTESEMEQRIVCAAIRNDVYDIICSPRHWDSLMRVQVSLSSGKWDMAEQGFVDQHGEFLTREQAFKVATEAGQIIRRCGGDDGKLFSENLY